jgi:hypothetical protein
MNPELNPAAVMAEMRAGRRVGVVAEDYRMRRGWLLACADLAADDERLSGGWGHGPERITRNAGGSVVFGVPGAWAWRGRSVDTLFIDADPTEDQLALLSIVTYSSADPKVVRR